jgi:hypothetical protein
VCVVFTNVSGSRKTKANVTKLKYIGHKIYRDRFMHIYVLTYTITSTGGREGAGTLRIPVSKGIRGN